MRPLTKILILLVALTVSFSVVVAADTSAEDLSTDLHDLDCD